MPEHIGVAPALLPGRQQPDTRQHAPVFMMTTDGFAGTSRVVTVRNPFPSAMGQIPFFLVD